MPILSNIGTIYKGEDITLNFTMDPVVNISGWTLSFSIRDLKLTDAAADVTASGSVTSGAAGTFSVTLTAAQTASLDAGKYAWSVWRTDSGSSATLALGTLIISGTARTP
jgi:hypothetical protein